MLQNINDANCNVGPSFSFLAFYAVFSYFDSIEGLMSLFPYSNAWAIKFKVMLIPFLWLIEMSFANAQSDRVSL